MHWRPGRDIMFRRHPEFLCDMRSHQPPLGIGAGSCNLRREGGVLGLDALALRDRLPMFVVPHDQLGCVRSRNTSTSVIALIGARPSRGDDAATVRTAESGRFHQRQRLRRVAPGSPVRRARSLMAARCAKSAPHVNACPRCLELVELGA